MMTLNTNTRPARLRGARSIRLHTDLINLLEYEIGSFKVQLSFTFHEFI